MARETDTAGVAEVQMRAYFSSSHLWGAQHFTRLAREIEDQHTGNKAVFKIDLRAYVTNAVLSAVAFLEASINEVYDDVADKHPGYVDPLSPETKRLLAGLWDRVALWPILDKYRAALLCSGVDTFDKGQQPYQDAKLLIKLRNQLIHARPKTQNTGDFDKLCKGLKTRFKPSRLMNNTANPYFPDHCLGAGCAGWAVVSAQAFADEFFHRVGMQPNYQRAPFGPP